jgi:hypothetical protein
MRGLGSPTKYRELIGSTELGTAAGGARTAAVFLALLELPRQGSSGPLVKAAPEDIIVFVYKMRCARRSNCSVAAWASY